MLTGFDLNSSFFVPVCLSVKCECSLTTPERSVHSDVRGALGRCRGVRLQAPGSDAGVSQLPFLHGLKAGPGSNASIHVHCSATVKALKKLN